MPIPSIQTSNNTLANSEGTSQLDIINFPTSASDTVENSKTPEFTKQSTLQSPHTTASSGTFPVSVLDSPHKNSDTDQWLLVSQNLSSLNSGRLICLLWQICVILSLLPYPIDMQSIFF